ncbi:hypothetical protein [Kordiimonas lacus]|uniref:Uncharacterized protein n=1 Tax=Kordiimonas lacus TaxID=637679 RepID=A0A1G6YK80_9PROT|nr:hypothetical protein [Kordiimonas lacus]SDD90712.1 hypothetical protein SAMN04488071_1655 [Kordiimonas lacus]
MSKANAHAEVATVEETAPTVLMPKWFQRLAAVCAIAVPVVIPVSMFELEKRSSAQERTESVAFEISSDAMKGVATMRDTMMVLEDIIRLHEAGMADKIAAAGFVDRFLKLRDESRLKIIRTGAEINGHLLRFHGTIDSQTLDAFAADARASVNRYIQPFSDCVNKMLPLVMAGENPKQDFDQCKLADLADGLMAASIAVSQESVSLGLHGRYDPEKLRDAKAGADKSG